MKVKTSLNAALKMSAVRNGCYLVSFPTSHTSFFDTTLSVIAQFVIG